MTESFVKIMKRDYIRYMPKPIDGPVQPDHRLRALQRGTPAQRTEIPRASGVEVLC